jgi:expansin (peptidoglycan-binding protein)
VNAAPAPKPAPPAPAPPAPAPAPPANNNPFHDGGFGTWFTQNGVAGACGTVHQDSDHVVALDARTYGNTGQQSPLCGKTIEITDTDSGKTFDGVVADACPTCNNPSSVDMSTSLFQLFAPLSKGELNIKWRLKN